MDSNSSILSGFPVDNRVETGSVNITADNFPAAFDTSCVKPDDEAISIIDKLNWALHAKDFDALANLFLDSSYWRDHLCLSWDYRCVKGRDNIVSFLKPECRVTRLSIDRSKPHRAPRLVAMDLAGKIEVVLFFVKVDTSLGNGQGVVRLTRVNGEWRILTCYTALNELTGMEEPHGHRRAHGKEHNGLGGNPTWKENRDKEINAEKTQPAVLIVGEFVFVFVYVVLPYAKY